MHIASWLKIHGKDIFSVVSTIYSQAKITAARERVKNCPKNGYVKYYSGIFTSLTLSYKYWRLLKLVLEKNEWAHKR